MTGGYEDIEGRWIPKEIDMKIGQIYEGGSGPNVVTFKVLDVNGERAYLEYNDKSIGWHDIGFILSVYTLVEDVVDLKAGYLIFQGYVHVHTQIDSTLEDTEKWCVDKLKYQPNVKYTIYKAVGHVENKTVTTTEVVKERYDNG